MSAVVPVVHLYRSYERVPTTNGQVGDGPGGRSPRGLVTSDQWCTPCAGGESSTPPGDGRRVSEQHAGGQRQARLVVSRPIVIGVDHDERGRRPAVSAYTAALSR